MNLENRMVIFLVDFDPINFNWLLKQFQNTLFGIKAYGMAYSKRNRTIKWRRILLFYNYILLAMRSLFHSKQNDIIISWNFIVGAFAGFFCKIFFLKRIILSVNMLNHEKGFFNTLIRKIVYNHAFMYSNFYTTVNSVELIDKYSSAFPINKAHFFVLPDCFRHEYENAPYTEGNGKVFCGGEAMRDWKTLFKAANLLPGVKFVGIARKKIFDSKLKIPMNVEMYYDTDKDFFYTQLKNSSVVAMPLSTKAPAGLIVMIRAALLSKPIIITKTSSTINYIDHMKNGVLVELGDETELANRIEYLMSNNADRCKLAENMHEDIKKFSPENYAKEMMKILLSIAKFYPIIAFF
jgi:glycosyltransferase involved in cell wall biosynthesis